MGLVGPASQLEDVGAETERLTAQVRAAFALHRRPAKEDLYRGDPSSLGTEAAEAAAFFGDKSWQTIADEADDLGVSLTMSALSFAGFAYYLPAFLILSFDVDGCHETAQSLVFLLWSFPEDISAELAPREKAAVVGCLEWLARVFEQRRFPLNHARTALDHYWAYFTDQELGMDTHAIQE